MRLPVLTAIRGLRGDTVAYRLANRHPELFFDLLERIETRAGETEIIQTALYVEIRCASRYRQQPTLYADVLCTEEVALEIRPPAFSLSVHVPRR